MAILLQQTLRKKHGMYEDKGLTPKVELLKQLVNMRLQNYKSVEDCVNEMVITALKEKNAGLKVEEHHYCIAYASRTIG